MRTVRTKVYKFDELSEEAKERAIETYRQWAEGDTPAWADENQQSMEEFAKIFPIRINRWSYGDRGEGVYFEFTDDYNLEEMKGQRLATYIWNNYRDSIYKGKYYSLWSKTEKSYEHYKEGYPVLKTRYSRITLEGSCPLTGYMMDNVLLDPIYDFMKKPDPETNFRDLLETCFHAWIKACNDEIEYQNSDEYLIQEIQAQEWEFRKDGSRFS
jgi:hypothetical protein